MIYLNGRAVEFGRFPNEELNLLLVGLDIKPENSVVWTWEDNEDITKLAIIKSCLDDFNTQTSLTVNYMPYSRMDRPNGDYAFSLRAMTNLLNAMEWKEVQVREPHSKATLEYLYNSLETEWCVPRINRVMEGFKIGSLFYPDEGAAQRYKTDGDFPTAYGKKSRDFLSGDIESFEIRGEVEESVLIVDDICSKGGTFVRAAKKLRERGANRIYLLVAYVEDNIFNGEIFDYIDVVFTSYDSELRDHPRIIKLQ